ncbi:MAG: PorT family protein [Bacteroides sp.]|nr:PorT family protein [Bacteroides sp.]
MKILSHILLSLITLLCFSTGASSQLRYGFRFGGEFASAQLKNAPGYSLDNRSGFSGGLDLEYQFTKCGFAPDLAIVYKRYNTRLKSDYQSPKSFGRDFIEVPLRLKYKFWLKSTKDLVGPMIYTGPSVMFRLDNGKDCPMTTKRIQAGWDVGIGFDIINFIQITGGYRFGLGNTVDSFAGIPAASLHTNGWHVDVTILFDF